jgi:hypothetical protein
LSVSERPNEGGSTHSSVELIGRRNEFEQKKQFEEMTKFRSKEKEEIRFSMKRQFERNECPFKIQKNELFSKFAKRFSFLTKLKKEKKKSV